MGQNLVKMLQKRVIQGDTPLSFFINLKHELCIAEKIDRKGIEQELKPLYSKRGRPAIAVRTIVGMLFLKRMFNESDESVIQRWIENPYWQYFTGEVYFQTRAPFNPSDFVYFRKRLKEGQLEKLLAFTVKLHKGAEKEKEIQADSTAQPKNITYPTDKKLYKKMLDKCVKIEKKANIKLNHTYTRTSKSLMRKSYNGVHPRRRSEARKAVKKLRTLAGRLVRDLERKLSDSGKMDTAYQEFMELCYRVISGKAR